MKFNKNHLKYSHISKAFPEDLTAIWSDPAVIKYTNVKNPLTLNEIEERSIKFKDHDVFIIKQDKETLGIAGCPCIDKDKN